MAGNKGYVSADSRCGERVERRDKITAELLPGNYLITFLCL
jgi:hypothetical protein